MGCIKIAQRENMPDFDVCVVGGINLDLMHTQFALSICPVKLVRHRNANRFGKDCGKGKKAAR
jgi:hypothetical protein